MSPEEGQAAVRALQEDPPRELDGVPVVDVRAYPEADLLRLVLQGGVRLQVRPSGTEPKVKLYGEAIDADPGPFLDELAARLSQLTSPVLFSRRRRAAPLAPRPATVDLDLEGETQHDPDHDDGAEHEHAVDRRLDDHGPHDVADDQDLEPEQDDPSEVASQALVGRARRLGSSAAGTAATRAAAPPTTMIVTPTPSTTLTTLEIVPS